MWLFSRCCVQWIKLLASCIDLLIGADRTYNYRLFNGFLYSSIGLKLGLCCTCRMSLSLCVPQYLFLFFCMYSVRYSSFPILSLHVFSTSYLSPF